MEVSNSSVTQPNITADYLLAIIGELEVARRSLMTRIAELDMELHALKADREDAGKEEE